MWKMMMMKKKEGIDQVYVQWYTTYSIFREKPKDGLICSYDQHEDSVYNVTWSPADAWTFASLSYSGRVVISQVPLEEKFKILGV